MIVVAIALVAALLFGGWKWYDSRRGEEPKAPEHQNGDFQIWTDTPSKDYRQGERGALVVHLKNNTGEDYHYQGSYGSFRPTVRLIFKGTDEDGEIVFDELPLTMEFVHYTVADGEVRDTTFSFFIPEDAKIGGYDLELSFEGCTYRQENVLRVRE